MFLWNTYYNLGSVLKCQTYQWKREPKILSVMKLPSGETIDNYRLGSHGKAHIEGDIWVKTSMRWGIKQISRLRSLLVEATAGTKAGRWEQPGRICAYGTHVQGTWELCWPQCVPGYVAKSTQRETFSYYTMG